MNHVIITGGLGFIGSELITRISAKKITLIETWVTNSVAQRNIKIHKMKNLRQILPKDVKFSVLQLDEFWSEANSDMFTDCDLVYHLGAISNTRCTDWDLFQKYNVDATIRLIQWCDRHNIPMVNASSASVYGGHQDICIEDKTPEKPLNHYATSKKIIDNHIRHVNVGISIASLRYFNVYSFYDIRNLKTEEHKILEQQSSPHYKWSRQVKVDKDYEIKLFEGSEKIFRDFINVGLVAELTAQFGQKILTQKVKDVFNIGTSTPRSFIDVFDSVNALADQKAKAVMVDFPVGLKEGYQYYTQASMDKTYAFLNS